MNKTLNTYDLRSYSIFKDYYDIKEQLDAVGEMLAIEVQAVVMLEKIGDV